MKHWMIPFVPGAVFVYFVFSGIAALDGGFHPWHPWLAAALGAALVALVSSLAVTDEPCPGCAKLSKECDDLREALTK